jgi:hypothetical protein
MNSAVSGDGVVCWDGTRLGTREVQGLPGRFTYFRTGNDVSARRLGAMLDIRGCCLGLRCKCPDSKQGSPSPHVLP